MILTQQKVTGFIAYSSQPPIIGQTIEAIRGNRAVDSFETWAQMDIPGRFIAEQVLNSIQERDCLIADISVLNFNVVYEIGYAIGLGKKVLLIINSALNSVKKEITELGIFDTIGWEEYINSQDLIKALNKINDIRPLDFGAIKLNNKSPVYLLDAKHKIDPIVRLFSRVKKAKLFFRSFDPNEDVRLSAQQAYINVAQSYGIIIPFLPEGIEDYHFHNLRGAFLAGLAEGMGKEKLLLQLAETPVPMDYRDLVTICLKPEKIDEAIANFAPQITQALQGEQDAIVKEPKTFLERLNLGATAAENEFRNLADYYLETDAYFRVIRGEVRVVLGRKGSGKTALFAQARDHFRKNKKNIVIDLKPEGYKLLKFKEEILEILQEGTLEHTLVAFWEYILLLELCYKILEKDKLPHLKDHTLFEPYQRLYNFYHTDEYVSEGDFSERMSLLLKKISEDFIAKYGNDQSLKLSHAQITDLLYKHNIRELEDELQNYLKLKDGVYFLIDNLDKGWASRGIRSEDLVIIRTLQEATRKIERQLAHRNIHCQTVIFLRNDVYERLIDSTSDRGKETKIALDWTDADALRELLRRRFVFNDLPEDTQFEEIWNTICTSHIRGEESSQYLIDRCLMRPRALIGCINNCKGTAVNRGHSRIQEDDVEKSLEIYSRDLVQEISLEIRDVFPTVKDNILDMFIGAQPKMIYDEVIGLFIDSDILEGDWEPLLDLLLWYGVLGFVSPDNETYYIYSVNYDINLLKGLIKKWKQKKAIYGINPAFWSGLLVD